MFETFVNEAFGVPKHSEFEPDCAVVEINRNPAPLCTPPFAGVLKNSKNSSGTIPVLIGTAEY